ncbi:osteomodulin isoform X2 [Microcebus murinus]|uniref:osteomodulin isoform X2 n=1 Tax=Microcebus murinus TaxID=30608 RepID=UPI003F6B6362
MGFLSPICIIFFFFEVKVYCQYETYQWDEDYDQDLDNDYQTEIQFHQSVEYGVPFHRYSLGCASECFCPTNFPSSMYCDNRKLKTIPNIPMHIQQLYLQFNEIEAVTTNSFINATYLKEINLSHNKIKSQKIDYELNVGHNKLKQAFYIPRNLEHLYLQNNEIEKINVTTMCPSIDLLHLHHLTYLRVDQNKLQEPISSYIFFCFPHLHTIYYGEQRSTHGQTIQLKTQVFRRFEDDDDDSDDHDNSDGDHEGQEAAAAEGHFDPHYY